MNETQFLYAFLKAVGKKDDDELKVLFHCLPLVMVSASPLFVASMVAGADVRGTYKRVFGEKAHADAANALGGTAVDALYMQSGGVKNLMHSLQATLESNIGVE